mmetsp:Transcript_80620/g.125625  ORF Transcript_80620/g.125625 Transcript_80620/m.125625 type:complete len:124 (+) Transcript_80620:230-601(+)
MIAGKRRCQSSRCMVAAGEVEGADGKRLPIAGLVVIEKVVNAAEVLISLLDLNIMVMMCQMCMRIEAMLHLGASGEGRGVIDDGIIPYFCCSFFGSVVIETLQVTWHDSLNYVVFAFCGSVVT